MVVVNPIGVIATHKNLPSFAQDVSCAVSIEENNKSLAHVKMK